MEVKVEVERPVPLDVHNDGGGQSDDDEGKMMIAAKTMVMMTTTTAMTMVVMMVTFVKTILKFKDPFSSGEDDEPDEKVKEENKNWTQVSLVAICCHGWN